MEHGWGISSKWPFSVVVAYILIVQSVEAVEYANCISAEGSPITTINKCPEYDNKQPLTVKLPCLELWEMWSTPSLPLLPESTLT